MVIDKNKKEFEHIPAELNGRILLRENKNGFLTIDAEEFKYIALNSTPDELTKMGFAEHTEKINWIKGQAAASINAKKPDWMR